MSTTKSPPCPCCELPKKEQYCAKCLQLGVLNHRAKMGVARAQVTQALSHAEQLLAGPIILSGTSLVSNRGYSEWRKLRAEVASVEMRCASLKRQIASFESQCKHLRESIDKDTLQTRKNVLAVALTTRQTPAIVRSQIAVVRSQQHETGKRIIHARRVLVREAVDVFGVKKRKVWEIAGLELPSPENFRLYPSATINAALIHTIHLLSLVTRYLSVSLPFVPTPPLPLQLPHVGRPFMKANIPFVATTRWRDKHTLWMSSKASLAGTLTDTSSTSKKALKVSIMSKSASKHRQTLIAFALLAHSVAYLAWTQGVPGIGIRDAVTKRDSEEEDELAPYANLGSLSSSSVLIPATFVLELIALMANSPTLGCRSHEPGTSDTIRHMGFGLDVGKVVNSVLAAEDSKWGVHPSVSRGREELSEGWNLLEVDT